MCPKILERVYSRRKLIGYKAIHKRQGHYFCYLYPRKDVVQIGFKYGAILSDPYHLLRRSCKQVRLVAFKSNKQIQKKLYTMIHEAAIVPIERKFHK